MAIASHLGPINEDPIGRRLFKYPLVLTFQGGWSFLDISLPSKWNGRRMTSPRGIGKPSTFLVPNFHPLLLVWGSQVEFEANSHGMRAAFWLGARLPSTNPSAFSVPATVEHYREKSENFETLIVISYWVGAPFITVEV
jgi:hypothetical protein